MRGRDSGAPRRRRPRYDEGGPLCRWCGQPSGKDNPARTWFNPEDLTGVMTPVCGPDCPERPAGTVVFDYDPLRIGHGNARG